MVVMDKSWYIDECNRKFNDTKFAQFLSQHFHAFLISFANISTPYTPLTVAETSLSKRLLLLTDVALIFVTF